MKTSAIRLGGEFLVLCEALTPVWLFLFYWQCCDGGMEAFFCKITAASVFTLLTCTVLYRFIRMTQTKGVCQRRNVLMQLHRKSWARLLLSGGWW